MKTATITATVPATIKAEAAAVVAAHGLSITAVCRELMARVAARDPATLAWIKQEAASRAKG